MTILYRESTFVVAGTQPTGWGVGVETYQGTAARRLSQAGATHTNLLTAANKGGDGGQRNRPFRRRTGLRNLRCISSDPNLSAANRKASEYAISAYLVELSENVYS
jgi:hypothetical protein